MHIICHTRKVWKFIWGFYPGCACDTALNAASDRARGGNRCLLGNVDEMLQQDRHYLLPRPIEPACVDMLSRQSRPIDRQGL